MISEPIFLKETEWGVFTVEASFLLIFFGDEAKDGFLPEEWIASQVKAINKKMSDKYEGISKIKDSNVYFDELLKKSQ